MCNYTAKYTYNNHGDTTLEYNDNGIELTFTGDMNCRDVLVYNGDACMEELMLELYTEISMYLEGRYAGATPKSYYGEYDLTALCAFEGILSRELSLD